MLDVSWINRTDKPAMIPPPTSYSVWTWTPSLIPDAAGPEVSLEGRVIFEKETDRHLNAHQVIHDQISVRVTAKRGQRVELQCEFKGEKSKFKSNPANTEVTTQSRAL
jgi:hypothetical protein